MDRSVLHVDIAAFPVAVERVIDRGLRGRPVVVVPPGSARALVLVVSQEAAREGVRAGMPLRVALRCCPGAMGLHPNEALYRRATGAVLALLGGYSPLVEPAAPGQTFLDLTGTARLFGAAQDAAARIRREIETRLRLKPTVGLATSKLVSRVAARGIRPDGPCDVFPGAEAPFLAPLRRLRARAGGLRVTLRHSDDVLARREERLAPPVAADLVLFARARAICDRARARRVRVRWIELRCLDVARGPRQLTLFGPEAFAGDLSTRVGAAETLADAVDRIRGRFGDRAMVSGRMFAGRAAAPAGNGGPRPAVATVPRLGC